MLFHSLQFLLFLPVVFALYWSMAGSRVARQVLLVVASLVFYAAWNPAPVLLLVYLTLVDWLVGLALEKTRTPLWRKAILGVSIVNNVGLLGLFKYADWLTRSVVEGAAAFGVTLTYEPLGLILPVGLSFIVFQGMSYTIDIYRDELQTRRSLLDVAAFMTFFPHVVAGPIVRASDFLPQLEHRPHIDDAIGARAMLRIATGMVKKLVIADFLAANLVDRVFADPGNYSGAEVLVAVVAYTLQIYYDFSAYSDIAIGTAALFGFVLKENFDKPYLSPNLFEFWRRWHMSLGSWLRDYVYIPLGGNRVSRPRVLFNLMATQIVGGIWHGADWRFVWWGLAHGFALCATRVWWWVRGRNKYPTWWQTLLSTFVTFVLVVEARIVFRAKDIGHAKIVFLEQLKPLGASPNLTPALWLVLGVAIVAHMTPHRFYEQLVQVYTRLPALVRGLLLVALALFIKRVTGFEVQPFIYTQF
jgi:alginate O-acetyltransferase complex protein AlgI